VKSYKEKMTILLFHLSGFRNFKSCYQGIVCVHWKHLFPEKVSYNRMVELCSENMIPLDIYLKAKALGECTGISFVDSTPLRVGNNPRIHSHRVFEGLAARGQCSIGWFFGFKLH
jgi:hypothetical protein